MNKVDQDSVPRRMKITTIVPVYNEEACIEHFFERYSRAIATIGDRYQFELMFINNASRDRTLEIIQDLRSRDDRVKIITHSRNFGYQASVLSGLTYATGDAFIIIDVDCEDPPEMIPDFIRHWEAGYDVVYGERADRPESRLMVFARKMFYRLTRLIGDWEMILDMAEFSLFTDRIRRQVLRNMSTFPYIRGELSYVGFRRLGVPYRRQPRAFGETHYNFVRMAQFAVAGIFTSSTFPLRLMVYIALPLSMLDLLAMFMTLFTNLTIPLNALIVGHLGFFCGCFAVLAIYISRMYKDSARRPVFIVDEQNSTLPVSEPATESSR